jgi:hypothetical protein
MQLSTKKFGGDPLRTYKALMRKLSREGHYLELKEKEFFKSKAEKRREDKLRGTVRTKKKLKLIRERLEKEYPRQKPNNKAPKQNKIK